MEPKVQKFIDEAKAKYQEEQIAKRNSLLSSLGLSYEEEREYSVTYDSNYNRWDDVKKCTIVQRLPQLVFQMRSSRK